MVYLTGAGPGNTEDITIRARDIIRRADVLIYDNLIHLSLLDWAKPECELIYVGKRDGRHTLCQDEINALLVEKGKKYPCVVRLKGGDPYVFGRGGEEGVYLAQNGIPFSVICGISSCVAVPAAAGIPVTHRECASAFHVITGHRRESGEELDFSAIARLSGTLVFLMGVRRMSYIANGLMACGMDRKTPCAVIHSGATQKQKEVFSTLGDIVEAAQQEKITSPSVIVVGDVCAYHALLRKKTDAPLAGKTIALTGTASFCQAIRPLIQKAGGDCLELGLIGVKPLMTPQRFHTIPISQYTWIVFSSVNGVKIFFDYWRAERRDIRELSHIKFGVIGEKTAKALYEEAGILAACIPEHFYSEELGKALVSGLTKDDRILLFRAKTASRLLTDILKEQQIVYENIPLYEIVTDWRKKDALRLMETDFIVFASASAVRAYHKLRDPERPVPKIVCIGTVTAQEARTLGYAVYKIAEEATAEGIIEVLKGSDGK